MENGTMNQGPEGMGPPDSIMTKKMRSSDLIFLVIIESGGP